MRLESCIRSDVVRRRLSAHSALGASIVLVVGWRPVALWLALAMAATIGAAAIARGDLADRLSGASERLIRAIGVYAAPAVLAVISAAHGSSGLAAAAFIAAGLLVHGIGQGDVGAGLRWLRRRRTARVAARSHVAEPRARGGAPPASVDSGQAMRTLLADLLDFSRLERGELAVERTPFDLPALIGAAVDDWRPAAQRKGLAFDVAGEAKAPRWVEGDPVRIRQILDTLLANAVKFTSAGSVSLTIGVEPRPEGQLDLILSVLDSGPGMTSAELADVFEAGPDAGSRGPAQGLSSHLAREIARLMGGELTVSSAPGLGAAFSLKLPLRLTEGGLTDVDTARGLRVLVVDDHAVYRHAFSLILETVCREVVCAQDGAEALDLLAAEAFDLVLMDLAMPRLGGIAATRRLRASSSRSRDVAVIALTASDRDEDRAACLAAGMNGFVSKPVDARELLGAIHAVLSGEAAPRAA